MTNLTNLCQVCGNPIKKLSNFKPRLYCNDNCRDFMKYKNALEKTIIAIKPTKEARKLIRGDIFRLCNSVSICTVTNKLINND